MALNPSAPAFVPKALRPPERESSAPERLPEPRGRRGRRRRRRPRQLPALSSSAVAAPGSAAEAASEEGEGRQDNGFEDQFPALEQAPATPASTRAAFAAAAAQAKRDALARRRRELEAGLEFERRAERENLEILGESDILIIEEVSREVKACGGAAVKRPPSERMMQRWAAILRERRQEGAERLQMAEEDLRRRQRTLEADRQRREAEAVDGDQVRETSSDGNCSGSDGSSSSDSDGDSNSDTDSKRDSACDSEDSADWESEASRSHAFGEEVIRRIRAGEAQEIMAALNLREQSNLPKMTWDAREPSQRRSIYHIAAEENNAALLALVLQQWPAGGSRHGRGESPSSASFPSILRLRCRFKRSPLHSAARAGAYDAVEELLRAGADANERDKSGNSSLHLAAAGGHGDTVQALLAKQASPRVRNKNMDTPLLLITEFLATDKSSANNFDALTTAITELLRAGADPAACNLDGKTPASIVAASGHTVVLGILLSACVQQSPETDFERQATEVTRRKKRHPMRRRVTRKQLVLHQAAERGHSECLRLMVGGSLEVHAKGLEHGSLASVLPHSKCSAHSYGPDDEKVLSLPPDTQVFVAPAQPRGDDGRRLPKKLPIESLGLQLGSSPLDAPDTSRRADTPLLVAIRHGQLRCVRVLLDAGADPNKANGIGETPLWLAIVMKSPPELKLLMVRALVQNGSHVNAASLVRTPQWMMDRATSMLRCDCCVPDATINALEQTNPRSTPLLAAVAVRSWSVAAFLLRHGADPAGLLLCAKLVVPDGHLGSFNHCSVALASTWIQRRALAVMEDSQDELESIGTCIDLQAKDGSRVRCHEGVLCSYNTQLAEAHMQATALGTLLDSPIDSFPTGDSLQAFVRHLYTDENYLTAFDGTKDWKRQREELYALLQHLSHEYLWRPFRHLEACMISTQSIQTIDADIDCACKFGAEKFLHGCEKVMEAERRFAYNWRRLSREYKEMQTQRHARVSEGLRSIAIQRPGGVGLENHGKLGRAWLPVVANKIHSRDPIIGMLRYRSAPSDPETSIFTFRQWLSQQDTTDICGILEKYCLPSEQKTPPESIETRLEDGSRTSLLSDFSRLLRHRLRTRTHFPPHLGPIQAWHLLTDLWKEECGCLETVARVKRMQRLCPYRPESGGLCWLRQEMWEVGSRGVYFSKRSHWWRRVVPTFADTVLVVRHTAEAGSTTDVEFCVSCHSFVLQRSGKLKALLHLHAAREEDCQESLRVDLAEVDEHCLAALITFLYTGQLFLSLLQPGFDPMTRSESKKEDLSRRLLSLVIMADEYLVPGLAETASLCLCARLNSSIALHAFGVGELLPSLRLLRRSAALFILRNLEAVASTQDAEETGLSEETLLEHVLHEAQSM